MIASDICLNNANGRCKHVMIHTRTNPKNPQHNIVERYCVILGTYLSDSEITDGSVTGLTMCSHYRGVSGFPTIKWRNIRG